VAMTMMVMIRQEEEVLDVLFVMTKVGNQVG
jgi:hypothetical protein